MSTPSIRRLVLALALLSLASCNSGSLVRASDWKSDPVWHDGLAEKAVYSASRVVYGEPRVYEMIVFTNKEQHDRRTMTKAERSRSTIEVFKHNQIEEIPTPNYRYHYATTSHLSVDGLELTRLDCSSQEFCGASFKQYLGKPGLKSWDYWSFVYFPEAGRKQEVVRAYGRRIVAADSLPLFLRSFNFAGKGSMRVALLPSQKSNRETAPGAVDAVIRYAGEDEGSHKLEVLVDGQVHGTYWMAKNRLHVMTRYAGADGQRYDLKELSRTNYWTIRE